MAFKAKPLLRGHHRINTTYLCLSHDEHAAWVHPCAKLEDARIVAYRMLRDGAHMAIVIDLSSHEIVYDASGWTKLPSLGDQVIQ